MKGKQMNAKLEKLVAEVAAEQGELNGWVIDQRKRVVRLGKKLIQLQKEQKKEQKETGQTWPDWCTEQKVLRGTFPELTNVKRYVLIAKYPGAYEDGMSIKEAYKNAQRWKQHGGNPPPLEKKTISPRYLPTIGRMAGKLERKIESLVEKDLPAVAEEQQWSEDEILGATDAVTLARQACNLLLRQLRELHSKLES